MDTGTGTGTGKKTLGRRKIEMKKIDKKSSLQVSFSKRKKSLFQKLCVECGADAAILVQSPAGNVFTFGNPSVESVLHRFRTGQRLPVELVKALLTEESRRELEETEKRLKLEEEEELQKLEGMELQELEKLLGKLEGLRDDALRRVMEMEKDLDDDHMKSVSPILSINPEDYYGLQYYSGGLPQGPTQFCRQNFNNLECRKISSSVFATASDPSLYFTSDPIDQVFKFEDQRFWMNSQTISSDTLFNY